VANTKGYISGSRKNIQSPMTLEIAKSVRSEWECVLLHETTIDALEEASRENGDSYDHTIKEALRALKEKRRKEYKRKHIGKIIELEEEETKNNGW
jgi:hypothetical protein